MGRRASTGRHKCWVAAVLLAAGAAQWPAEATAQSVTPVEPELELVPQLNVDRIRKGAESNRKSPNQTAPGQRRHLFTEDGGALEIIGALNATTRIVLDPTEVIIDAQVGDPAGWDFEISSARTFDLQPKFGGIDTNLMLRTESDRFYLFSLKAVGFDYPYQPDYLVWVLLWEDGVRTDRHPNAHVAAREAEAEVSETERRRAEGWGPDPVDEVSGRVTASYSGDGQPRKWDDPWNPNYNGYNTLRELHANTVRGPTSQEFFGNVRTAVSDPATMTWDGYAVYLSDPTAVAIAPTSIWNDGTHTILEFPRLISELPTVQHLYGEIERPTNATPIGATNTRVQVDVVGDLVLRLGQMVVCITYANPLTEPRGTRRPYQTDGGWWTVDMSQGNAAHRARRTNPGKSQEQTQRNGGATKTTLNTQTQVWQPIIQSAEPVSNPQVATTPNERAGESGEFTVILSGTNWTDALGEDSKSAFKPTDSGGIATNVTLERGLAICQRAGALSIHCELR